MGAYLLVLFAIATRVALATGSHAPHPWWNFTAVGGSLLFFGARRSLKQMWIPVAALMVTDFVLTRYAYHFAFHPADYLITWGWYAAAVLIGFWMLHSRASVGRIIGASFASSTLFFLVTNFAGFYPETMYAHTWAGVIAAYTAGIPFYVNDLVSTLVVTGAAFGAVALLQHRGAGRKVETAA
jgi:multisubunit Na+/H+ antiporter MnhC subunit